METHTTNINELPVDYEQSTNELPEQQLKSSLKHVIDPEIKQLKKENVTFNENIEIKTIKNNKTKDTDKMIILATLLFIMFNEPFIKNYIMNILVVIIGSYIRNSNGTTNKYGVIIYGLFYGILLYTITFFIDIPSLEF
jgi:hypothetical protein|tara:strand:- start:4940 stop:5356 length:417 start_codon:yes stop_codon:yes gene_type:complete